MSSLRGRKIVFTGFRDKTLVELIEKLGAIYQPSITKETEIVVVGGPKGIGSNKVQKAIEMGKTVIDKSAFYKKYSVVGSKGSHLGDCPKGKIYNPRTKHCSSLEEIGTRILPKDIASKKCPEGKVVNLKTGRCNKVSSHKKSSKTVKKSSKKVCKPGKVISPKSGRCVKVSSLKSLKKKL